MIKKINFIFISFILSIFSISELNNKTNNDIKNVLDVSIQQEYVLVEDVYLVPSKNTLKISTNSVDYNENKIYNNLSNNGGRVQLYENQFGTKLDGYDYDVVLPDGVPTVEAPNVIGMTLEEANSWSMLNLNRNATIFDTGCFDSSFAPGTITKQSPLPGSLIPNDYDMVTTNSLTTGLTVWIQADNCQDQISE